jgi:UDP-sugar transporter A1/2/3
VSSSKSESEALLSENKTQQDETSSSVITKTGLQVLVLLAVQNCSKNLLMRYVMKDQPNFLTSAAVIGVEVVKLVLSTLYILLVDKRSIMTIVVFMREDWRNSLLLGVPAAAYSLQMSLEYVALANLNAAMFSVLVQCKLLFTATFAVLVLRKKLKYVQVLSLVLLTTGVMLCNLNKVLKMSQGKEDTEEGNEGNATRGILATLGT